MRGYALFNFALSLDKNNTANSNYHYALKVTSIIFRMTSSVSLSHSLSVPG